MKTLKLADPQGGTQAPAKSPWMTFEEAAAYLSMTVETFRRTLDRPADELAKALRPMLIVASERRRYLKRRTFMDWLEANAS